MAHTRILAAFATALALGAGGGAQAQDVPNNTSFGNWVVNCEAVTVTQNFCQLVQQHSVLATNEVVAQFAAFPNDNDTAVLLAQVPIGVYLPGGAVYRLDDQEQTEQKQMVWQRCLGDVCEAAALLDAEMLASMETIDTMLFGYRMDADADPVVIRVDLKQLVEGLNALRGDN